MTRLQALLLRTAVAARLGAIPTEDCDHTSYSCRCAVCRSEVELRAEDLVPGVREGAVKRWRQSKKRRY